MSASARCLIASHGATYKTVTIANTTKLKTEASAAADIGLMAFSLTGLLTTRGSAFPKPVKRVLSFREPGGGTACRAFEHLLPPPLPGFRDTPLYSKGQSLP